MFFFFNYHLTQGQQYTIVWKSKLQYVRSNDNNALYENDQKCGVIDELVFIKAAIIKIKKLICFFLCRKIKYHTIHVRGFLRCF